MRYSSWGRQSRDAATFACLLPFLNPNRLEWSQCQPGGSLLWKSKSTHGYFSVSVCKSRHSRTFCHPDRCKKCSRWKSMLPKWRAQRHSLAFYNRENRGCSAFNTLGKPSWELYEARYAVRGSKECRRRRRRDSLRGEDEEPRHPGTPIKSSLSFYLNNYNNKNTFL